MANTDPTTQNAKDTNFIDVIYDKITNVIGGDSASQYFCMTLPGTLLNPDDYSYDTAGDKPAHVKANESKLVNKLFDAAFVSASDNGKQLSDQYKTALNMLSPKLNKELFELKIKLRAILMTPYEYDFGNGKTKMTLEQVFYRLYRDYIQAKNDWDQKQLNKKAELEEAIIDPRQRNDKYLEWYGRVAENERVKIEEKLGKVLSVFSPTDMDIINSILNCGTGAEIERARSLINMVEELSPDGGYVYPVNLYPRNWFKMLDSSFTGVDLLESSAALSQKLHTLQLQRRSVLNNISNLTNNIPDNDTIAEANEAKAKAEKAFNDAVDSCVKENIGASKEIVLSIVDLCLKDKDNVKLPDEDVADRVINKDKEKRIDNIKDLIGKIEEGAKKCYQEQSNAVKASGELAKAALNWCGTNNQQLKALLAPLQSQLDTLNAEIEEIRSNIVISRSIQNSREKDPADVLPNSKSDGFTQVLITSTMSSLKHQSQKEAEASNESWGASFFLGGYSSNKSHEKAVQSAIDSSDNIDIQIGMNIAKVQIERNWFNPGIFLLSKNMYNFSGEKISPETQNISLTEGEENDIRKQFDEMNKCIFPSYPVSFIIAKDVTIKFTSASSLSSSFAETVEDHSSKGGGFFIFSGNSSSASNSSQSNSIANSNANSITIRFTTPQILGYYIQATPADKSTHISNTQDKDMSVIAFISKFREMLSELNKNLNVDAKKVN